MKVLCRTLEEVNQFIEQNDFNVKPILWQVIKEPDSEDMIHSFYETKYAELEEGEKKRRMYLDEKPVMMLRASRHDHFPADSFTHILGLTENRYTGHPFWNREDFPF